MFSREPMSLLVPLWLQRCLAQLFSQRAQECLRRLRLRSDIQLTVELLASLVIPKLI